MGLNNCYPDSGRNDMAAIDPSCKWVFVLSELVLETVAVTGSVVMFLFIWEMH